MALIQAISMSHMQVVFQDGRLVSGINQVHDQLAVVPPHPLAPLQDKEEDAEEEGEEEKVEEEEEGTSSFCRPRRPPAAANHGNNAKMLLGFRVARS